MGMAASQARYLGLTARKTNVEYEGQQVNQARLALANQSAGLFNQLLTLEVPQPPSSTDFTKVQYSYQDGLNAETISNMTQIVNDPDGYNYNVTHYHYEYLYRGQKNLLSNPQVAYEKALPKNIPTYVGNNELNLYSVGADKNLDSAFEQICKDWPDDFASKVIYNTAHEISDNWYDANDQITTNINDAVKRVHEYTDGKGNVTTDTYVNKEWDESTKTTTAGTESGPPFTPEGQTISDKMFDVNGVETTDFDLAVTRVHEISNGDGTTVIDTYTDKDWSDVGKTTVTTKDDPTNVYYHSTIDGKMMFSLYDDLMASAYSGLDPTKPVENQQIKLPEFFAIDNKEKIERTQRALVDINGSGRAESVRYEDSSVVYTLEAETITDEIAYEDAMNQYNYERAKYDKQIEDINAKTEKIQAEDRTLELRLRQLDTEQEALQTEMEAVKKVIDKNIESTFKTFE